MASGGTMAGEKVTTTKKKPPLEKTIKDYFDQYGAILVGMHQDLKMQQKLVDRKLEEAESRIDKLTEQFDKRFSTIASDTENKSNNLQIIIRENISFFNQRGSELVEIHKETIERLNEINHKIEANRTKEVKFNNNLRITIICIAAALSVEIILMAILWKT